MVIPGEWTIGPIDFLLNTAILVSMITSIIAWANHVGLSPRESNSMLFRVFVIQNPSSWIVVDVLPGLI